MEENRITEDEIIELIEVLSSIIFHNVIMYNITDYFWRVCARNNFREYQYHERRNVGLIFG